ncbi:MAG: hypothetical protein Q7S88_00545 [Candidatus Daviesbacteria bacterium]|nr:hypothetical protein [Candidatus Daviesbacteria bacterium]
MQAQRLNITLPYEIAKDLRRVVPAGERSQFIAEAVRERISQNKHFKKEWAKGLKANYDYYKKIGKEIEEDFKHADEEILERLP